MERFSAIGKSLQDYHAFLIGEEVGNPIHLAQEAYALDKNISVLLLNDSSSYDRMKQALQFSPFIGPTVQCISNAAGLRMAPIVEDALQRTAQRRSFAKMKSTSFAAQHFAPNALEKVRTDFTTKVLEEAPIGAVLISGTGIIFSINSYALGVFNKSEKDVLGTLILSLFPESMQADINGFLSDGYLSGPKQVFKVLWTEGPQYLELSVALINMTASGDYKLVMISNITSEIVAQQRTQAHLEELEKLNAKLARVNADLDTFVYTASHDLKSPILNIEGLVASLEDELGPAHAAVEMQLEHIRRSILRFKQTVEDLTEVSRIQRSFEEEAILVDVAAVLEDVRQLLEREIAETGAVIEVNAEAGPTVFISKRNLNSILYNLVSNAIKYRSPSRQPFIQIHTWRENESFYIVAQDNGLGIPAANRDRVFQLFKRMHSHVKGSGVGLYIVKRIVENYGGSITVKSEEGKGSVFEVILKEHTAC